LQRIAKVANKHDTYIINVHDIAVHCSKQKKGKAIGLDDIQMEAYMFGGTRLHIHLAILFNCFIKFGYLPKPFMQSMTIPLMKAKNGDLTDVNNYRAIAVSTAISELFECVIADQLTSVSPIDMYQFGFTQGHSTALSILVYLNVPLITTVTTSKISVGQIGRKKLPGKSWRRKCRKRGIK